MNLNMWLDIRGGHAARSIARTQAARKAMASQARSRARATGTASRMAGKIKEAPQAKGPTIKQ